MKKINYLLHNVTVINFLLLSKLVLRYRPVTFLAILAFGISVPYFYFSQPVIYQKETHFKVYSDTKLNEVLQESITKLNMPEVMAVVNTYDFSTRFAKHLADSPSFKSLNFQHPTNNLSQFQALENCKDSECRISNLRYLLPSLFSITSEQLTGRFSVKITTRSSETTMEVLRAFQQTLEEIRIQNASELANKQLKQMQDLVSKSKAEIEAKGGFEKVASSEFLDALIVQNKNKISNLSDRLIKNDSHYFSQRIRLKESNLTSESSIDGPQKLGYENYLKVNKRIDEIRQNIASINSTPIEARTQTDGIVLTQLKKELSDNEAELKRLGHVKRNIALDDSFINTQKGNKSALEFDYRVSSAQVNKLRDQHEAAKTELDDLYIRKANLEAEVIGLKPDLEYLKLLESKLVAIKFKQSSITSDVFFEQYGSEVTSFKRSSLSQIVLFAFIFIGFFTIIIYLTIYMFDDRIFEELEIEKCIDELPIVGHAPHFE